MENGLAGCLAVVDADVESGRLVLGGQLFPELVHQLPAGGLFFLVQFKIAFHMPFGKNEGMAPGDRIAVLNGSGMIVLLENRAVGVAEGAGHNIKVVG